MNRLIGIGRMKQLARRMARQGRLLPLAALCLLALAYPAQADFRKALEALQNRDGTMMLAEVRDAVEKKNDDGLILFLSILKQYPKTWRPTLTPVQQAELFGDLEKITSQGSLQSQYRLAVIPRQNDYPIPNSSEAIQEEQNLIKRLEPVAEKGYAYAALHLYGNYANRSPGNKSEQTDAIKWLIKSAELGNAEAAFRLGMKYLNVVDDYYGCFSYGSPRCLPKDEAKGWYWMQRAAMWANERNIMLGDFAYEMGKLYQSGVADQKPESKQAYLWYLMVSKGLGGKSVLPALEEMRKTGQLKVLNPTLDDAWDNITKRLEILEQSIITAEPPRLLAQKNQKGVGAPVFSYSGISWLQPNQILDVYSDGRVNLLVSDPWQDIQNNNETWFVVTPRKIEEFLSKLKHAQLGSVVNDGSGICEVGCYDSSINIIKVSADQTDPIRFLSNRIFTANYKPTNPQYVQLLALIEDNFPIRKLLCDSSVGEVKRQCILVGQSVDSAKNQGEKR